jgi:tetratricopeptide (TPR) repeat protein
VELDPSHERARATLGWALFLSGRRDEGVAELERASALAPGSTIWLGQLGQAYAMAGREERAREVLRQLEARAGNGFVTPYHLAYVYTGLGEADRAIDCLERAVRERTGAVYGVKGSFLFTALHDHPRFQALLRRMRLA